MKKGRKFPALSGWALILVLVAAMSLPARASGVGPVTGFALPRFVSMKTKAGYVRRGPGFSYKIDWVLNHINTPLKITAEHGYWRRVEDEDGQGGWMHYRLLSGVRTVVVRVGDTPIRAYPSNTSEIVALAEKGVISRLGDCKLDWCRVSGDGYRGWVEKEQVFGVFDDEIRE